jgi:hypothetical protein
VFQAAELTLLYPIFCESHAEDEVGVYSSKSGLTRALVPVIARLDQEEVFSWFDHLSNLLGSQLVYVEGKHSRCPVT